MLATIHRTHSLATRATFMNASGLRAAGIHLIPKAGNIRFIGIGVSAVTSPPVYALRLETVTASRPTGTLFHASATATLTPTASFQWTQLAADIAVARGDVIAAVMQYSSGTIGGSNTATLSHSSVNYFNSPFTATYNGSSWSINGSGELTHICVKYDDGTILGAPVFNYGFDIGSVATTAEAGSAWIQPFAAQCFGARVYNRINATDTVVRVSLYDSSSNSLASCDIPANALGGTDGERFIDVLWTTPVALTANATYRIGIKATSGAGAFLAPVYYFSTSADRAALSDNYNTTRTGSGAWTDTTTRLNSILPLFDSVTAGGLVSPFSSPLIRSAI